MCVVLGGRSDSQLNDWETLLTDVRMYVCMFLCVCECNNEPLLVRSVFTLSFNVSPEECLFLKKESPSFVVQ